jgi:hypothetical protein
VGGLGTDVNRRHLGRSIPLYENKGQKGEEQIVRRMPDAAS